MVGIQNISRAIRNATARYKKYYKKNGTIRKLKINQQWNLSE